MSHWLVFPKDAELRHIVLQVDSQTPKRQRKRIRAKLEARNCQPDSPRSVTFATKVFESSITLPINGLVNTNMAIVVDRNGHLNLCLCAPAQTVQREGRAGRMHTSRYKSSRPRKREQPSPGRL